MTRQLTICDVVRKLVGHIHPAAAEHIDAGRFENLKTMTQVIESLLVDVHEVAALRDRPEASVKRAAVYADEFLAETAAAVVPVDSSG